MGLCGKQEELCIVGDSSRGSRLWDSVRPGDGGDVACDEVISDGVVQDATREGISVL